MFTPQDLEGMKQTQEDHMMDTCIHLSWETNSTDVFNLPKSAWTSENQIACGFLEKRVLERLGLTEVPDSDGAFRLPRDMIIDQRDRLVLTHRYGSPLLEPVYFETLGSPVKGPSALLVTVRRVTDGRSQIGSSN